MKINTQRLPFERWHDSRKVKWNSSREFFIARLIRFLWNPRFLRVDWWDLNTTSRDVIARYVVNDLEFPNNKCRPVRVANELVVCNWRQLISVNFFYWFSGKFMFPHVACKRFSDLSHVFNIQRFYAPYLICECDKVKTKQNIHSFLLESTEADWRDASKNDVSRFACLLFSSHRSDQRKLIPKSIPL